MLRETLLITSREIFLTRDSQLFHFQINLKFKTKVRKKLSRHSFLVLYKWVKMHFNKAQSYKKILQKNCYFKKIIINFSKVNTALFDRFNFLKIKLIYHRAPSSSLAKFKKRIKWINISNKVNIQAKYMINRIY